MRKIEVFKRHLREKRAIKVISGINNYNLTLVKKVATAAQAGLASAVDVAAAPEVIKVAKANTNLPIFASSINPFALLSAVKCGADAVEIGNYEAYYKQGRSLTADEVYDITLETMSLVSKFGTFICVTIPGVIPVEEQIELAKKLELLGVDLIQTESVASLAQKAKGAMGLIEVAKNTIANTMELSRNVDTPIMSSSGLTTNTVPMAFSAGASAVGVGSAINKLDSQIAMVAAVRSIVGSISYRNTIMQAVKENTFVF